MHNRGVGPNSARATARRALAATIALAAAIAVGVPTAVAAQTGYPGPTSTTPPQRTEHRQNAGQVRTGESVVIESCGFAAGAAVTVAFNGEAVGPDVAGADGCVDTTLAVRSDCPGVTIDGAPRDGKRGRNEIVVAGEGANTATRSVITGVSISCSAGGNGQANGQDRGTGDAGSVSSRDAEQEGAVLASLSSPLTSDAGRAGVTVVFVLGIAFVLAYRELRRRRRRALL